MAEEKRPTGERPADSEGATKQERRSVPMPAPAGARSPTAPLAAPAVADAATAPPPAVPRKILPTGTVVGRYEVVRLVGEGGMGTVYEALDARLGRRVALKVLSPELKSKRKAAKRFAIEAQAAARLDHPNVVGIFDFDMNGEIPYMAMEFLDGETLASAIARGSLPFDRLADVMLAVCAGVHAAHGKGIVHRDLKPSNIFLCRDWQGRETARVLDFGISKVGGISGSGLTETGDIVGTSQYLSPEQAAGARHVNEASDQFSLGVVMYECVTGQTPQHGLPIHELLRNVSQGRHLPAHELRADVPSELEAIIEQAMSVRPKDRFRSVHELGRALFPFASAEVQRRFDDYYRSDPDARWPTSARGLVQREARAEPAPTLRQPDEPLATWQARTTRTSASHPRRTPPAKAAVVLAGGRMGADGESTRRAASHPLYSIAVGAVLAALALGILLLVLQP